MKATLLKELVAAPEVVKSALCKGVDGVVMAHLNELLDGSREQLERLE